MLRFRDLKRTIQKDIEFNDKVRSAMMYPMFIIVVFAGVLFLWILTFVVPKIGTVFFAYACCTSTSDTNYDLCL